jgi:hypothetical protein
MHNLFGYWTFVGCDVVVAGMPLFLVASWLPLVITYAHLVSISTNLWQVLVQIAFFAILATGAHWYLLARGLLLYADWTVWYTLALATVIHAALLYYLYASDRLVEL